LLASEQLAAGTSPDMTFTIIGRDPENGAIGVATATGSIAVGAQVPHCRFGVGAVATQGWTTSVRMT
jgi:uncharacterized Ntn-hydrolase superfamily protein